MCECEGQPWFGIADDVGDGVKGRHRGKSGRALGRIALHYGRLDSCVTAAEQ